jgi:hypothetical protein
MNSRRALCISFAVNCLLLAVCGVLFWRGTEPGPQALAPAADVEPPRLYPANPAAPATSPAPAAFHWSQLESTDYRTYVANLRSIGCPEQTVRDIVTADLDSAVYAPKREQLRQRLAANGGGGAVLGRQSFEAKLRQEELRFVNALLGQPAEPETRMLADSSRSAQTSAPADQGPSTPASMPLIFLATGTNALGLNESQLAAVERLKRQFVQALGGEKLDPNGPEYAARWAQAQPLLDQRLRTVLGREVYYKLHLQALRQTMISDGAQ